MKTRYESKRTQTLALIGIFAALTAGVTLILKIPMGNLGYINLGDVTVMIGTLVLPFRGAVFAAALGSSLADIAGGYPNYAVFTLFIKSAEVLTIYLLRRYLTSKHYYIPFIVAGMVMAGLYAVVDGFMYQSLAQAGLSFLSNAGQGLVAALIVSVIYPRVQKLTERIRSLDS